MTSNLQEAVNLLSQNGRPLHLIQTSPGNYYVPTNELANFDQETGDFLQVITQNSFEDGLLVNKRWFPMSSAAHAGPEGEPELTQSPSTRPLLPVTVRLTGS